MIGIIIIFLVINGALGETLKPSYTADDIVDTEITVPSYNKLMHQLSNLFTDSYSREKKLPNLSRLAGQTMKFSDLLIVLTNSDKVYTELSHSAFVTLLINDELGININILSAFIPEDLLLNYWLITNEETVKNYDPITTEQMLDKLLFYRKEYFDTTGYLVSQGPLIVNALKNRFYNPPQNMHHHYYGDLANIIENIVPFASELILPMIDILDKNDDFWSEKPRSHWNKWRIASTLSYYGDKLQEEQYTHGLHAAMKFYDTLIDLREISSSNQKGYYTYYDEINTVLNLVKCYGAHGKQYVSLLFYSLSLKENDGVIPYYKQRSNGLVHRISIALRYILENDIDDLGENEAIRITANYYSLTLSKRSIIFSRGNSDEIIMGYY